MAFEFNKSALLKESLLFEMVYDFLSYRQYNVRFLSRIWLKSYKSILKLCIYISIEKKQLGLIFYACTIPEP